ncbi:MAG TPA: DUF4252 domain-containing protein [Rhodothermales bacterium]|nr:DUF4252 domain-containing protein [Rhodothermales bacterium]
MKLHPSTRTGLWATVLLLVGLAGPVQAQNKQVDLDKEPGYVNLDFVEQWFDKEPKVIVNIKGALLNLVAEASRYEDPDLAELLHKLKAIQVRGFSLRRSDFEAVTDRANGLAKQLESDGWDTVVRVRDYDENVDIFVRVDGGAIAGMVVMAVSPSDDETFFVNIVGDINPEEIGRIGRKFDIDPLDRMTVDY